MASNSKIYPFSTGTQYMHWLAKNCDLCSKGYDGEKSHCAIEEALSLASVGDGSVTSEIAVRMGNGNKRDAYCWPCPEFESVEDANARQKQEIAQREKALLEAHGQMRLETEVVG